MNMRNLCAALMLALVSTAGFASSPDELRPYLNLGLHYVPQDTDDRKSDDGLGFFAGGGVPINRWFTLEGDLFQSTFNRDSAPNNNKWEEYGAQASGLLTLPIGRGWIPYLAAGAGVTKSHLKGFGSDTGMHYSLGSGVFYLFSAYERDWGLRFDARYRETDGDSFPGVNDNIEEAVVRFGVMLLLGESNAQRVAAAKELDSDGDGVPDSKDLCPDTPAGVKVDAKGCPVAAEVGGPADDKGRFGPVYFDFDKSNIKASEAPKLDAAVEATRQMERPKIVLKLDGHTDSMGTTEYNQGLGERRANAVKQYLQSKGVNASDIVVTSYGEVRPAATNDNDEGRALNRRVEIFVTDE